MNKISPFFFLLLLTTGLGLSSCGTAPATTPLVDHDTVTVELFTVAGNSQPQSLSLTGKVEALQSVALSARVMGTITKFLVAEGQQVKQGQLLVQVNAQDVEAKRGQVEAQLVQAAAAWQVAKRDVERYTTLYQQKSATAKELESMTLHMNVAEAQWKSAKEMSKEINVQLGYALVRAPFDGIVVKKMSEVGSMANPGMPLLVVEGNGRLQITVDVPENNLRQIQVGQVVQYDIEAAGKKGQTRVGTIVPSAQFTGGQYQIKLPLTAEQQNGLYAGMFAKAFLALSPSPTNTPNSWVKVPVSALVKQGQLTGLYVVTSHRKALLRWVKTGKEWGNEQEILTGLAAGEQVVAHPHGGLYNGVNIRTTPIKP